MLAALSPGPRKAGRRKCAVQAFSRSENLEIGGIHFRRFEINQGAPTGLAPWGPYPKGNIFCYVNQICALVCEKIGFPVVDKYVSFRKPIEAELDQAVENSVEVVDNSPYQEL